MACDFEVRPARAGGFPLRSRLRVFIPTLSPHVIYERIDMHGARISCRLSWRGRLRHGVRDHRRAGISERGRWSGGGAFLCWLTAEYSLNYFTKDLKKARKPINAR